MGLFDYLHSNYPGTPEMTYQTKDTPIRRQRTYILTSDGRLLRNGNLIDFTGMIQFHAGEIGNWWEYRAQFNSGQLIDLTAISEGKP